MVSCTVSAQSCSSAIAMILSAVSVFTIWSVPDNHVALVGVSCLFSAVTVTVFGALNVVNIVTYDVDLRYVLLQLLNLEVVAWLTLKVFFLCIC